MSHKIINKKLITPMLAILSAVKSSGSHTVAIDDTHLPLALREDRRHPIMLLATLGSVTLA